MIKKLIFLLISVVYCVDSACAQYRVSLQYATKDAIMMRCVGYGKKAATALIDAEQEAIRTLLFYGVSGTRYNMPLVSGNKTNMETKYKKFFETFYAKEYRSFIESSVIVTPFGKNALKQKCLTADVCVRISQLRNYLETNNLIRKFGL